MRRVDLERPATYSAIRLTGEMLDRFAETPVPDSVLPL